MDVFGSLYAFIFDEKFKFLRQMERLYNYGVVILNLNHEKNNCRSS